jgi:hypothetical protein
MLLYSLQSTKTAIVWEVGNRDDAKEITVSYNNYYAFLISQPAMEGS